MLWLDHLSGMRQLWRRGGRNNTGPFALDAGGDGETGGFTDEGRDQPGPVVVDGWGVAVSLVVTRRE